MTSTLRQRPRPDVTHHERPAPDLDDIDRRIIAELVAGARMSNRQLAERIGVAPSTALVRTQALLDRGVITGFTATLDLAGVGRPVQALVSVTLDTRDPDQIREFTERTSAHPAVVASFQTAGAIDYLFHLALPTTSALRDWVFEHIATEPAVASSETTLIFTHIPGNASLLPAVAASGRPGSAPDAGE